MKKVKPIPHQAPFEVRARYFIEWLESAPPKVKRNEFYPMLVKMAELIVELVEREKDA